MTTKEKISAIVEDDSLRRTGRTTRLVDFYIQEIFTKPGQWIEIRDHYDGPAGDINIWKRLNKRLGFEHNAIYTSELLRTDVANHRILLVIDHKKFAEIVKNMEG